MIKVTFKKHTASGPYRSFQRTFVDVKVKRRIIGSITETSSGSFRCRIMVKDAAERCGWRWLTFTGHFTTEADARQFFIDKIDEIYAKYAVHAHD